MARSTLGVGAARGPTMLSSEVCFKFKFIFFVDTFILRIFFQIVEMNDFRDGLSDISAKNCSLMLRRSRVVGVASPRSAWPDCTEPFDRPASGYTVTRCASRPCACQASKPTAQRRLISVTVTAETSLSSLLKFFISIINYIYR